LIFKPLSTSCTVLAPVNGRNGYFFRKQTLTRINLETGRIDSGQERGKAQANSSGGGRAGPEACLEFRLKNGWRIKSVDEESQRHFGNSGYNLTWKPRIGSGTCVPRCTR
jgi:hypothetical protein